MRSNVILLTLCALLLALSASVQAQQPAKVPRLGYLGGSLSANVARIEALRQGLRELGYVEGKNIFIDWRDSGGKLDRLPALAADLVQSKVDVIVTGGPASTRPLKEATSTIPIVMAQDPDPVGNEFISSLARPGGNITGLSTLAPELSGKRLELLKEIIPKFKRVAVVGSSKEPGNAQSLKEIELASGAFGVQVQYLDVLDPKDIETALRAASKARADAVLFLGGPVINAYRTRVIELAVKDRLPAIYYAPEWVEDGGLITYSVSFTDLFRRAATYVAKILKGAKPGDLPVEQPTRIELILNLKAAEAQGLKISPSLLLRADQVIR